MSNELPLAVEREAFMFEQDVLVEIPENRRRYFGGEGLMLLPGRQTVEAALRRIPAGQVRTTGEIARELAAAAGARGTCPVTLRRVMDDIADDDDGVPWWRAVCADGAMFAFGPDGREGHAKRLRAEGVQVTGEDMSQRVFPCKREPSL
jgi:alkylated DNA nucleotide flippase Atl1